MSMYICAVFYACARCFMCGRINRETTRMNGIPIFLMDEHRDAYYLWHRMIDRGDIPAKGGYLLHVDHHDDLESAGYNWDLTQMPQNAREALAFTDQCLGIADFIIPAVWEGTFGTVHILKELVPVEITQTEESVSLMKGSRQILVHNAQQTGKESAGTGSGQTFGSAPWLIRRDRERDENQVKFVLRRGGLEPWDRYPESGLVLDVDLDYFCWDDSLSSVPPQQIEITKQAYEEFRSDRNHPFRILASSGFAVKEEDGRHWLYLQQFYPPEPLPDDETVCRRMDRLLSYFARVGLKPCAIDICRSNRSGYLPAAKAQYVEETFIKKLGELYPIESINNAFSPEE